MRAVRRDSKWDQVRMSVPVIKSMSIVSVPMAKLSEAEEIKVMEVFGGTVLDSLKVIEKALSETGACPKVNVSVETDLLSLGWDNVKGSLSHEKFYKLVQIRKARYQHFLENDIQDAEHLETFEALGGGPQGQGTISRECLFSCAEAFGLVAPFNVVGDKVEFSQFKDVMNSITGTEAVQALDKPKSFPIKGIKSMARGIAALLRSHNDPCRDSVHYRTGSFGWTPSHTFLESSLLSSKSESEDPKEQKSELVRPSRPHLLGSMEGPPKAKKSRAYTQNGAGLLGVFSKEEAREPNESKLENKLHSVFSEHRSRLLDVAADQGNMLYDYLSVLIHNERQAKVGDTRYLYQRREIRKKDQQVLCKPFVSLVVTTSGNELSFKNRCGRPVIFDPVGRKASPPRCFKKWQEQNTCVNLSQKEIDSMLASIKSRTLGGACER
eukprot:TRINITY_DN8614_c0_g1_i1.p1 TRINITY_DN8614_c0_g1~~TRINITY_DN8614_c0_g1_i1.p1  ORF type:complete len:438 (+),score=49.42 TRINITY_DN8614_c0_g1_i1:1837-3150(+)